MSRIIEGKKKVKPSKESDTVTVMTEKMKLEDVITALVSISTDNTEKIAKLSKKIFYLHLMMLLYVIAAVCHGVL